MSTSTDTNNNAQDIQNDLIGKKFFSRFEIKEKIYTGSIYDIYKSLNTNNNEEVAIKIIKHKKQFNSNITKENNDDSDDSDENYQEEFNTKLGNESFMLSFLKGFGIPALYSYGYNSDYDLIILELLGQSLNDLFKLKNKKFSLKTT